MTILYKRASPSADWEHVLNTAQVEDGFKVIPAHKYEISILLVIRTVIELARKYKFSSRELFDLIGFVFNPETPIPKIKYENLNYYSFLSQCFVWMKKKFKFK